MNRIAKYTVALFAGLVAVAPAVAGDNSGMVSAVLEPQYWVMAISTIALVGLGIGKGQGQAEKPVSQAPALRAFAASNATLA